MRLKHNDSSTPVAFQLKLIIEWPLASNSSASMWVAKETCPSFLIRRDKRYSTDYNDRRFSLGRRAEQFGVHAKLNSRLALNLLHWKCFIYTTSSYTCLQITVHVAIDYSIAWNVSHSQTVFAKTAERIEVRFGVDAAFAKLLWLFVINQLMAAFSLYHVT